MVVTGRRWRLAAVAAVAATALAGCGLTPGTAAVVESSTISHDRVDDVAVAVCSANLASAEASGQPAPSLATRGAREIALQILLETEIWHQFGEHEGVEANQQQVSEAVAQNETGIALLPKAQQEDFRTALRDYTEGQFILVEAGRQALGPDAGIEESAAKGGELLGEFVQTLDVEVDPRYGRFEDGQFKRGGTSLSVPASREARAGAKREPGDAFVGALPASQQCR